MEESDYTTNGKSHASPHLFLFEEVEEGIKLTSYEIPDGFDASTFTYDHLTTLNYDELKVSAKFTPALYQNHDGVWEGGSESMFSPVLKFTLHEIFSADQLEVFEPLALMIQLFTKEHKKIKKLIDKGNI